MFCGTVSLSACWLGVCTEGCIFVHHSDPGFSEPSCVSVEFWGLPIQFWVIAVGLLWRRQSLCRVIYVMYISGGSPLHHFMFVDVLFGGGVPDDRSVFKCWSNKGLIMFSII